MKFARAIVAIGAAACSALAATVIAISSADAADAGCRSDFGTKVPVLTVHGFNSGPGMWDQPGSSGSMNQTIDLVGTTKRVATFNYQANSSEWVTSPNIGYALAQRIRCLADASLANGGHGKVIVIAHSMGGLALREAASWSLSGQRVANDIGLAIMIGTPNLGAPVANDFGGGIIGLCRFNLFGEGHGCIGTPAARGLQVGSKEIKALAPLPATVPLREIAGDVTLMASFGIGLNFKSHTKNDNIVPVSSATAGYTTAYPGDGKFVFACSSLVQGMPGKMGSCAHSNLVTNFDVQLNVIQALGEYVRSLVTVEATPTPSASCIGRACNPVTPTPVPSPAG